MSTAFVLSGGASLGAVQVGAVRALLERGITPDLVVGSSVGAVNGAWLAARPDLSGVDALARIWTSIRRADIFPIDLRAGIAGLLGRSSHLVRPQPLARLLERHLGYERIEDARVPLHIVTTEVLTGQEVVLSEGKVVPAVMASAAIPGVFPPVDVAEHLLMDGGVVDNAPISHAVRCGATAVYVLPTGYACALPSPPRSALGMALQALTLLIDQQLMTDIGRYEDACELHVIPPLCPLAVSPADFSASRQLIDRAHRSAAEWLDAKPVVRRQSLLLQFHHHAHESTP